MHRFPRDFYEIIPKSLKGAGNRETDIAKADTAYEGNSSHEPMSREQNAETTG